MSDSVVASRDARKIRHYLNFIENLSKFSWLPTLSRWHPWLRPDKTDIRWLPINEDIEATGSSPLPVQLVDTIIDEASHRVILDYCACRKAFSCKGYPTDIGCLMMGDSALEISPGVSRVVDVEEAKAHARRAFGAGLIPAVGKARVDNFLFGVKDRGRLMTVCFCCECCCLTRYTRHMPMKTLEQIFPRLDGISVEVTDECTGCGTCVEHCFINAMRLDDNRAVIGEQCRACGRCASVCPSGAVKIAITQADFLDRAHDKIRSYIKYD
jgi:UDP-glucose 4-epimerase